MRDFRAWWALFVFFAVLSVLVLQHGYRRWRRLRELLPPGTAVDQDRLTRHRRREGWRLVCMAASLVVMTGLVFAGVMGAPRGLLLTLRILAVACVAAVVVLSVRR
ncbi:MAG TPA: hypothetical protein VFG66_12995 [Gemmatimonadales bacterium]|nr:hypothetical protein [Gemmatimonadales bacterium]